MFDFLLIDQGQVRGQALKDAAAMRGMKLFDHSGSWEEGLQFLQELTPRMLIIGEGLSHDQQVEGVLRLVGQSFPVIVLAKSDQQIPSLPPQWKRIESPISPLKLISQLSVILKS